MDVINIVTAPEIEILIILSKGKYQDFKKSKLKPSDYCKQVLRMPHAKNYDFLIAYFSDVFRLIDVIHQYKQIANVPKGELALSDLLV